MMGIDDVIENFKKLDLEKYPEKEIRALFNQIGPIGSIVVTFHQGKSVMRARANWGDEKFSKKSDFSFKPSSLNTTFQRASTPQQTMFYATSIPDKIEPGELDNMRIIGLAETIPMMHNKDQSGKQRISFGRWYVKEDINLVAIVHKDDYIKESNYIKELFDAFIAFSKNAPTEIQEKSHKFLGYLADEFSKSEIRGDYDYMISAIFTELATKKGFDGVIYPSVRVGGKGFNIAITPEASKKLELRVAGECTLYKKKDNSFLCNNYVIEIDDDHEFEIHNKECNENYIFKELGIKSADDLRMKSCIYCNREKDLSLFSQEHVLPRSLGGALINNPFSLNDVCITCNTISGFFIDAPFAKSWFVNNHRADNAKKFVHLNHTTVLPLVYFGEIEELSQGERICEFWLGPTGDAIYHFHLPNVSEKDKSPIVGYPPTIKKSDLDYGFIFLFVRSNNPVWHPCIFNSVLAQFKESTFYLGNGPTPKGGAFSDIPEELKSLHNQLTDKQGEVHENRCKVALDTGERFLAKLALGFGSLLLNETFKESKSANLLRKMLWTKDPEERRKLPIRGTGFLGSTAIPTTLNSILKWDGAHVFALIAPSNNQLALYVSLYEENTAVIQMSDELEDWDGKIGEGICFVVLPGLQKSVGPISLLELIAHKDQTEYKNSELEELEKLMSQFDKLPEFDV